MKLNDAVAGLYSGLSNAVGVPSNAQAVRDYLDIRKELPKKDRNGLKTLRNILLIGAAAAALTSCGNACGGGPLPSVNSPPAVTSSYNGATNTLSVKAEDIDGVIAGMYQNGSDVLGDDTNPNADVWEADYVNLPAGSHTFKAVDDSGDDDSITVQIPYENVTATASLDASSVQHNMDDAAEVNASVSVSDGGYTYAKWSVDGVYAGTSNESEGFGVNVDFVGTKAVTGELYNSLDEKLADVSAGSVDGLNTAPDAPKIYKMQFGSWVEVSEIYWFEGFPLQMRVELPDVNSDVVETMDYQSGTDSWDLFNNVGWGDVRPTTDSSVPNVDDVYILRDPENNGDDNLYEVTFNTDGRARGPPYTMQFQGKEENTPGQLESTLSNLNIYIQ